MAGSVNKVILVGNLGADPEVRRTQDGRPIVNLRVATSDSWRDKSTGERKEKTEWHRVVIFSEGLAKIAEQYLKKGSKVYLEGALQTRKWQDKDGQDRYSTEVVLQGFNSALTFFEQFLPIARYMADARAQDLPLLTVGDSDDVIHDWAYLFGKFGVLDHDTQIAHAVRVLGWLGMVATLAWFLWRGLRATASTPAKAM